MREVLVAGAGIHPFGRFDHGYREMGEYAARECLRDAGVAPEDLDMVFVANVGAEMAKGHNIMDRVARIGKPVINVEAACASSGSALFLASRLIESGGADGCPVAISTRSRTASVTRSSVPRWCSADGWPPEA